MTKAQESHHSREEQNTNSRSGASRPSPTQSAQDQPNRRLLRIKELNDRLRTTGRGGMTLITNGIGALGLPTVNAIFAAIAEFKDFNPDNDPWGEHDCAFLTVNGTSVIFKIDYLDRSRRIHSPDPADPKVTVRVMTVMLADKY
jgi:Protein of unknown function (DUF3768)